MTSLKKLKPNSGFSIHCHHDILVEYCYDYAQRVEYIKENKPQDEIETRLRLFKLLPKKALKDIPLRCQKAYAEWQKAYAEWQKAKTKRQKAYAEWQKAYAEWQKAETKRQKVYDEWQKVYDEWQKAETKWQKAYDEWQKAHAEWQKAYDEWPKKSKDAFHKKWCGCKYWDEKKMELVFPK